MAEFVLNVHDIAETPKDFEFPVSDAWLRGALEDTDLRAGHEGALKISAHKQGRDVVINGRLTAGLVGECARCLNDANLEVDTRFATLLVARGAELRAAPDEAELTPEELDREFFTGETIVLDASVREQLLLEVPMQVLCTDECAGIAVPAATRGPADLRRAVAAESGTSSGENGTSSNGSSSVDPRFAPLLKLVGKVPPTEE
ncbi:MAG: DUF177 domain-containing protein [Sandaracinaceae bacterium]